MVLRMDGTGADRECRVMNPAEKEKLPWYFKNTAVVIAVLSVGPLALPLIWLHPKMTASRKVLWSVVILILSYLLYVATMDAMSKFEETYRQLKTMM